MYVAMWDERDRYIYNGMRQNLAADDPVIYKLLLDLEQAVARRGFRKCRVLQSTSEPGLNKLGEKKRGEQERGLCAFGVSSVHIRDKRTRP